MTISVNWETVESEATELLSALIRIDTANPPGNEAVAADFIGGLLAANGIPTTILEPQAGRANLVARLERNGEGDGGPLLLLSHLDVAPATGDGWRYPPFSGTVANGFVWGRGAVDMKHIVVASVLALLLAKRAGLPLERDLILAATADEESAGESGAGWLWRCHPELVECELAISEGGDAFEFRGVPHLVVATGQKGWVTIDLTRRSRPRHSSIPTTDNCLYDVGILLDRLRERHFPHRLTWTGQRFVHELAALLEDDERQSMLALVDAHSFRDALTTLDVGDEIRERLVSTFYSHATPTELHGGQWRWAIPAKARLGLAGRVLPGETRETWLGQLEEILGPLGDHELSDFETGIETVDSATFDQLSAIVRRHSPGARVVPALSPGSDLQHPFRAGAATFGFFPLGPEPGVPAIWDLAHSVDERISVANLMRCVRYAWDVVCVKNGASLD